MKIQPPKFRYMLKSERLDKEGDQGTHFLEIDEDIFAEAIGSIVNAEADSWQFVLHAGRFYGNNADNFPGNGLLIHVPYYRASMYIFVIGA